MMINWIDPKKIPPTLKGSYLILLESDDNRGMGIFIATFRSKKIVRDMVAHQKKMFLLAWDQETVILRVVS